MKNKDEINQAIARLQENKTKCREISGFGDNIHDAIDASIETLKEDYDQDDLDEKLDSGDWEQHTYDAAVNMLEWKQGDDPIDEYLYPEVK